MDLDGVVIHNEGRLKGWGLKSRLFWDQTLNVVTRLYWCLIEFIDWTHSQSCCYFSTGFVKHCPSNLLPG
jgi:hypothetical protein